MSVTIDRRSLGTAGSVNGSSESVNGAASQLREHPSGSVRPSQSAMPPGQRTGSMSSGLKPPNNVQDQGTAPLPVPGSKQISQNGQPGQNRMTRDTVSQPAQTNVMPPPAAPSPQQPVQPQPVSVLPERPYEIQCGGFVQNGARCQKVGNLVQANGYCMQHQFVAIRSIRDALAGLKTLVGQLTLNQALDLGNAIAQYENQLDDMKQTCLKDIECRAGFMNMTETIAKMDFPDRTIPDRIQIYLERIQRYMLQNQKMDERVTVERVSHHLLNRAQQEYSRVEQEFMEKSAQFEQHKRELTQQSKSAQERLDDITKARAKAEAELQYLQSKWDSLQSTHAVQTGTLREALTKAQEERDTMKSMYETMLERERKLGQQVKQYETETQGLNQRIVQLDEAWKNKMLEMRDQFAKEAKAGVLTSAREQELTEQVNTLTEQLKRAADDYAQLEQDNQRLSSGSSADPSMDILNRLKMANETLKGRENEVARQTAEIGKLREFMVNAEIKCATMREEDRVQYQTQIAELQQRVDTLENERANKQRQIAELSRSAADLSRTMLIQKGEASQRVNRLQSELQLARENLEHERSQFKTQRDMVQREVDQQRAQMQLKYREAVNQLNERYERQKRALKTEEESLRLKTQEKEQTYASLRADMDRAQKEMARRQQDLQEKESRYINAMNKAEQDVARAKNTLAESQAQVARFHAIEQDYITQISLLQQKTEILREENRREVDGLQEQVKNLMQARQMLSINLEKCSAGKEELLRRINDLSASFNKIRSERELMKKKMETMRIEFEAVSNRMRAENQKIKNDAMQCASKLQLCSQVHNHVVDIQKELEGSRSKVNQTLAAAHSMEDALKMAQRQKEQSATELTRLQDLVRQVEQEKRLMKVEMDAMRADTKDLRHMNNRLTEDMNRLAEEYKQSMDNQEAERIRERRRIQAEERNHLNKIKEMEVRSREDTARLQAMAKQKASVQNILADSQIDHARQVSGLIDAEQMLTQFLTDERVKSIQPTGRSNLLRK